MLINGIEDIGIGVTVTDPANPDTDGDGLPDPWEILYFNNLLQAVHAAEGA